MLVTGNEDDQLLDLLSQCSDFLQGFESLPTPATNSTAPESHVATNPPLTNSATPQNVMVGATPEVMESDVDHAQLEAAFQQLYDRFKTASPEEKNNFSTEITSLATKLCGTSEIPISATVMDQEVNVPKIEITDATEALQNVECLSNISESSGTSLLDPRSILGSKDIPSSPRNSSSSGFDSDYESAGSPTSSINGGETFNTFESELENDSSEGLNMDWSTLTLSSLFPPPTVEV